MIKVSFVPGQDEFGVNAIPLNTRLGDRVFEKTASGIFLPSIRKYIDTLRPEKDAQYVLLNAMGALEYYGANVNSDGFSEECLNHVPGSWAEDPLLDIKASESWPYGLPTFYRAGAFLHHRNKVHDKRVGDVTFAAWHPHMKRVELVVRVDRDRCRLHGGDRVWQRLQCGEFPDVSMGTRVKFDLCSICTDWASYALAKSTFDPVKHASPDIAILAWHKRSLKEGGRGVRGLAENRSQYCAHMKDQPNAILSDGRRVFVFNPYPRFFDISFVFIGADKTAKVMAKLADADRVWSFPGAKLAEVLGYEETEEKVASADEILKRAFLGKRATMDKRSPPNPDASLVKVVSNYEPDIPDPLLDRMAAVPLESALSTAGSLGIVLKPREFQRICLIRIGRVSDADSLDRNNMVFERTPDVRPMSFEESSPIPWLSRLLEGLVSDRSAFSSPLQKRLTIVVMRPEGSRQHAAVSDSSHLKSLLSRIGAGYNGYRKSIVGEISSRHGTKEAQADLTGIYLESAYEDQYGMGDSRRAGGDAPRDHGCRNTFRRT